MKWKGTQIGTKENHITLMVPWEYLTEVARVEEIEEIRRLLEEGDYANAEKIRDEIEERWDTYRIIRVFGDSVKVRGNTYPIRDALKEYGFRWDSYERVWGVSLTDLGIKQLLKFAGETYSTIEVQDIPPAFAKDLPAEIRESVEKLKALGEERDGGIPKWVIPWKKAREVSGE